MPTQSMNQADELLDQWSRVNKGDRVARFHALPRELSDDFFLSLDSRSQADLVLALPEGERRLYARLLAPDDAADMIQEAPEKERGYLMTLLDEITAHDTKALLTYRADAAGGLMNTRYPIVRPDFTIDEATTYLRQQLPNVQRIYYVYVLDQAQKLLGVLSLKDLILASPDKLVQSVMTSKLYTVAEDTDQEAVTHLMTDHGIQAVPVVDALGRMKGVITVDDMVDVVREEAAEDVQKVGGMEALDGPYLETSFIAMLKKRAGWLIILFIGEMLTATAMGHYEHELEKAVVLALFIPLLISSGGNSGSQATSLIIQAMAMGELRLRDWWIVIRREVMSGVALGSMLGIVGFTRIVVWQSVAHSYGEHWLLVAITIALTLVGVVTFGTLAGSMLPFILRRCGLDPASASAPFVATLVDVSGLIIYFSVAKLILSGTLL
jgi:magnesium transporter